MPGRRRSREAPNVRRAQILEAAERAFLERGVTGPTMDDVAHAAGIAKGTIYLYFPSREALVRALQTRLLAKVEVRSRRLLDARAGGFAAQLDRFVAGVVDDLLDYPELQHLVLHDAPRHGALDPIYGPVAIFIERGVASGELVASDPGIAARFMVDGLLGALAESIHEPRLGRKTLRESLVTTAAHLLTD